MLPALYLSIMWLAHPSRQQLWQRVSKEIEELSAVLTTVFSSTWGGNSLSLPEEEAHASVVFFEFTNGALTAVYLFFDSFCLQLRKENRTRW